LNRGFRLSALEDDYYDRYNDWEGLAPYGEWKEGKEFQEFWWGGATDPEAIDEEADEDKLTEYLGTLKMWVDGELFHETLSNDYDWSYPKAPPTEGMEWSRQYNYEWDGINEILYWEGGMSDEMGASIWGSIWGSNEETKIIEDEEVRGYDVERW
jgi:hypothetical protein